ncbi:MAG: helix-turn-helix domain-containing protein [Ruminiclostridium sp.]
MFVEGLHEKDIFSEGFPFRLEINTEVNFEYPVHWHTAIELLYVESSNFNISVNNGNFDLEEGDILFIANGDTHGFSNQNNIGRRIFIQFDPSAFNAFGCNNIIKPLISNTFKISSKDIPFQQNLKNHIVSIVESYSKVNLASTKPYDTGESLSCTYTFLKCKKDFGFELFLSARIYDILAIISYFLAGKVNLQNSNNNFKKIHGLEKLKEAFKYIDANYMNDISLPDVAKSVGFSEFYFSRIFKDITEKNFSLYLNEYRIKQAEQFLIKSNMSVADIAYTVGFNSIVTFNRAFKSIKGCSPSVYKKIGQP